MFDSNAMNELAAISRDRYQRNGGGGAHKVYNSSKAYHDARGYQEMRPWAQLVYRTNLRWHQAVEQSLSDFRWDCLSPLLDVVGGEIPF